MSLWPLVVTHTPTERERGREREGERSRKEKREEWSGETFSPHHGGSSLKASKWTGEQSEHLLHCKALTLSDIALPPAPQESHQVQQKVNPLPERGGGVLPRVAEVH